MRWFAYNGDADGICSMVQWALEHGLDGELVTGVKRDIELLDRVKATKGDELIAMDISLARNHSLAKELIGKGVKITWIDHHLAGEEIPGLISHIDTSKEVCTAIIVDGLLDGKHRGWAIAAAYGDGLHESANRLAQGFDEKLAELGELLNYNSYGSLVNDLHFHPNDLFAACLNSITPENFMQSEEFSKLQSGFAADIAKAESLSHREGQLVRLPCEPWARRVVGVFAHRLKEASPDHPHVIALDRGDGSWQISIRANEGVGEFCQRFGGGGRATAGGIDVLSEDDMAALMSAVYARWLD